MCRPVGRSVVVKHELVCLPLARWQSGHLSSRAARHHQKAPRGGPGERRPIFHLMPLGHRLAGVPLKLAGHLARAHARQDNEMARAARLGRICRGRTTRSAAASRRRIKAKSDARPASRLFASRSAPVKWRSRPRPGRDRDAAGPSRLGVTDVTLRECRLKSDYMPASSVGLVRGARGPRVLRRDPTRRPDRRPARAHYSADVSGPARASRCCKHLAPLHFFCHYCRAPASERPGATIPGGGRLALMEAPRSWRGPPPTNCGPSSRRNVFGAGDDRVSDRLATDQLHRLSTHYGRGGLARARGPAARAPLMIRS
jgi:hypothetical protein